MPGISVKRRSNHVNSLVRGLDILLILNRNGASHVRDLFQHTGLPKPTIMRMLTTLREAGYVTQRGDGRYAVTARTLALSTGFDAADHLLAVARPVLQAFREDHAWPSDLAIFDRDAMVVMDTSRIPGTLSLNRGIGTRLPMTPTAFGRAYLAHCAEEERDEILRHLRDTQAQYEGLASEPQRLLPMLERARERGFATSDQEYLKRARIVAVPVIADGMLLACVNMLTVASAMTMAQAEFEFVPALKMLADDIAERFLATDMGNLIR